MQQLSRTERQCAGRPGRLQASTAASPRAGPSCACSSSCCPSPAPGKMPVWIPTALSLPGLIIFPFFFWREEKGGRGTIMNIVLYLLFFFFFCLCFWSLLFLSGHFCIHLQHPVWGGKLTLQWWPICCWVQAEDERCTWVEKETASNPGIYFKVPQNTPAFSLEICKEKVPIQKDIQHRFKVCLDKWRWQRVIKRKQCSRKKWYTKFMFMR